MFRVGNHVALPTFVNEGKSTPFLLDTGSTSNLLDTRIGSQYSKVGRDDTTVVRGIQGEIKQVFRTDKVSLRFAGFRYDNSSVVAIDMERMSDSFGVAIGGIIGLPVLQQLKVTLDYEQGTVQFQLTK